MKTQSTKFWALENTEGNRNALKAAGYMVRSLPDIVYSYILINPVTKMFSYGRTYGSYIELETEEITSEDHYDTHDVTTLPVSQNRKRL